MILTRKIKVGTNESQSKQARKSKEKVDIQQINLIIKTSVRPVQTISLFT